MAVSNLVSVCIPTLNRAHYLQLCLESVAAQSYQEIEIIICDNASTDQTSEVVSAFKEANPKIPLMYFQQSTLLSMVENWNTALRLARGEYAILLSDDDLFRSQAIDKLVQEASKPDTAFAYCDVDLIDGQGNIFGNNRKTPP